MAGAIEGCPRQAGFEPDPWTLGPMLPKGFDGDAWVRCLPAQGWSFLVRAWDDHGRVAIGRGLRYEDACRDLRSKLNCFV